MHFDVASSGRSCKTNCVTRRAALPAPLATSWCPSGSVDTVKHPNVALLHLAPQEAQSWNNCCPSSKLRSCSAPPFDSRDASWPNVVSLRPRRPPCPHPAVSTRGPYSGRDGGTSRRAERVAMTLRPEVDNSGELSFGGQQVPHGDVSVKPHRRGRPNRSQGRAPQGFARVDIDLIRECDERLLDLISADARVAIPVEAVASDRWAVPGGHGTQLVQNPPR